MTHRAGSENTTLRWAVRARTCSLGLHWGSASKMAIEYFLYSMLRVRTSTRHPKDIWNSDDQKKKISKKIQRTAKGSVFLNSRKLKELSFSVIWISAEISFFSVRVSNFLRVSRRCPFEFLEVLDSDKNLPGCSLNFSFYLGWMWARSEHLELVWKLRWILVSTWEQYWNQ